MYFFIQVIVQGSPTTIGRLTSAVQQQQGQGAVTTAATAQDIVNRVAAAAAANTIVTVSTQQQSLQSQPAVVTVAGIMNNQLQAKLVAATPGGTLSRGLIQGKHISPAQLQLLRQHSLNKKTAQDIKARQLQQPTASGSGNKVSVAVSPGTVTLQDGSQAASSSKPNVIARQLSAGPQTVSTKPGTIRAMTESEMRLLLAKQSSSGGGQASKAQVLQVNAGSGQGTNITAQILTQGGNIQLQQQSGSASGATPVAALVKTSQQQSVTIPVALPAVKAALQRSAAGGANQPQAQAVTASPQQMQIIQRQILQQRAAASLQKGSSGQQKVTVSSYSGNNPQLSHNLQTTSTTSAPKVVPAQLIVSSGGGSGNAGNTAGNPANKQLAQQVTVQQFMKQQPLTTTVLAKTGSGHQGQHLHARVIPVSASRTGGHQHAIQVVSATPGTLNRVGKTVSAAAPNVTIDSGGLPVLQSGSGGQTTTGNAASGSATPASHIKMVTAAGRLP